MNGDSETPPAAGGQPAGESTGHGGEEHAYETERPFDYRWTQEAYSMLLSGELQAKAIRKGSVGIFHISGACPRCGHYFEQSDVLEAVTTGERARETPEPERRQNEGSEYAEADVACACSEPHTGRPANDKGCGIKFRVDAAWEQG
ncbi:hypothetical protein [Thermomonospora cellulosilytica]|uniref:Uncharacterized protein n=1 Tax=Thermomonospora cellulosilytica TaxID=1411118 RepID=A0A7W3R7M9_9ACTN|nr:hypothetical protein [Thermomonospora cellulosilytica]MBA9002837.1 hypothetical protein [Thermomonospora cellulosilytica]